MPSDVSLPRARRGRVILASWLNRIVAATFKVLFGGDGVLIERFGQRIIVSAETGRVPADPVTPKWIPWGTRGGNFTNRVRRGFDVMRRCRAVNVLEKAVVTNVDTGLGVETFLRGGQVDPVMVDHVGGLAFFFIPGLAEDFRQPNKGRFMIAIVNDTLNLTGRSLEAFVSEVDGQFTDRYPGYLTQFLVAFPRPVPTPDDITVALGLDEDGLIENQWHYMVDGTDHTVIPYRQAGGSLGPVFAEMPPFIPGNPNRPGVGDGELNLPRGIAANSTHVFIMDTGNDRVQKWLAFEGRDRTKFPATAGVPFVDKWGETGGANGAFSGAWGIAATDDIVVVADTGNDRIQIFDTGGGFLLAFGTTGAGDDNFSGPKAVAVDIIQEEIFVADTGNHRIKVHAFDGTFHREFGTFGTDLNQFDSPANIDVMNGFVAVTDTGNGRRSLWKRQITFDTFDGEQTEWWRYTSVGAFSLGVPDGGASVPALQALRRVTAFQRSTQTFVTLPVTTHGTDILSRFQIVDIRDALEKLAPAYVNLATLNPYNWTPNSPDNLYFATFRTDFDWTRSADEMFGTDTYDIDINEVVQVIQRLQVSSLTP